MRIDLIDIKGRVPRRRGRFDSVARAFAATCEQSLNRCILTQQLGATVVNNRRSWPEDHIIDGENGHANLYGLKLI